MRKRVGIFIVCALLLAGCAKPLPPDKQAYVGKWQSPTMALLIDAGGMVRYKRVDGHMSTSVNAPLKAFEGDNFVVGVGPATTTFKVSVAPHEEHGQWKMVVDGVELIRVPPGA